MAYYSRVLQIKGPANHSKDLINSGSSLQNLCQLDAGEFIRSFSVEDAQLLDLRYDLSCHHSTAEMIFLPLIVTSLEDLKGTFSPSSKAKSQQPEITQEPR